MQLKPEVKQILLIRRLKIILIRKAELMEKRIGTILIVVYDKFNIVKLNQIISEFGEIIHGRQGLSLKNHTLNVISLVVEGSTDEISSFTGKLGRIKGVTVKSVLAKDYHED